MALICDRCCHEEGGMVFGRAVLVLEAQFHPGPDPIDGGIPFIPTLVAPEDAKEVCVTCKTLLVEKLVHLWREFFEGEKEGRS